MVEFQPVADADFKALAADIRSHDLAELRAVHGEAAYPLDIIRQSSQASAEVLKAMSDGELWCVFGVAPVGALVSPVASPWSLGTPAASRHAVALIRATKRYIAGVRERYPMLVNFVDARNIPSIGYLKAVGFTIDEPQPFGARGLPFHRFHMGLE